MSHDIREWLEALGLDAYVETFLEKEIDLEAACDLSEADLKELGIQMGPRKKLLRAIATLADNRVVASQSVTASPEGQHCRTPPAHRDVL